MELNFDSTAFNYPRTVNGKVIVILPFASANGAIGTDDIYGAETSVGDADSVTLTVVLYKVSGTTETQLGTATTGAFTDVRSRTYTTLGFDVDTGVIKKGDKLRLEITFSGTENGTGAQYGTIFHNPTVTLSATYQPLSIYVPFKIDL
jgi:hypothetical protein